MSKHKQLFLTEIDKHRPNPYSAENLRAYIVGQSLFVDQLLTADSQFNNNPSFRSLIFPKENIRRRELKVPNDLGLLVREGYLLPAIRKDFTDLHAVQKKHIKKKVSDTPSKQYVNYVMACLNGQRVSFDGDEVSGAFKKRVLQAFSSSANGNRGGLSQRTANRIRDYSESRTELLYIDLRKWLNQQVGKGIITRREYKIADNKIGDAYRHNVPYSMGVSIDVPLSQSENYLPIDIRVGNKQGLKLARNAREFSGKYTLPPMLFLSRKFLQKVSAEALIAIKGSRNGKIKACSHYENVIRQLREFRIQGQINLDDFVQELHLYMNEVQYVFSTTLPQRDRILFLSESNKSKVGGRIHSYLRENGVNLISLVTGRLGMLFGLVWANFSATKENLMDIRQRDEIVDAFDLGLNVRNDRLVLSLDKGHNILPRD